MLVVLVQQPCYNQRSLGKMCYFCLHGINDKYHCDNTRIASLTQGPQLNTAYSFTPHCVLTTLIKVSTLFVEDEKVV